MKRGRKAHTACMQCKRAHLSCSDVRPCERCVIKHIEHMCDDNTLQPPVPFTDVELQSMHDTLGDDVFEALSYPEQFDFITPTNELDYINIFLEGTGLAFSNETNEIIGTPSPVNTPSPLTTLSPQQSYSSIPSPVSTPSPVATPSPVQSSYVSPVDIPPSSYHNVLFPGQNSTNTPITSTTNTPTIIPNNNNNVHMVHGIIVNQPPPSFLAKNSNSHSTQQLSSNNGARNVAVVRSVSKPTTTPLSFNNFDSSNNNLSTSLSPVQHVLEEEKANAENEKLKTQMSSLEDAYARLQSAMAEKDKQLMEMQERYKQMNAKLRVISGCKIVPQALDLSLVKRSKEYGLMIGLYDYGSGKLVDYNKNLGRLLKDIYGPDYESLPLKWLPGPNSDQNITYFLDMLVRDRFKESIEKYTYVLLPNGDKLPFLLCLTIQCWERPAGPVINCTYWI